MSAFVLSDFDYSLPEMLIASSPMPDRSASRLLVCQHGHVKDASFRNLVDYLNPGDLLVFNNTKVIPARLYGRKETGGQCECLVERLVAQNEALVHIKSSKSPKPGTALYFAQDQLKATMLERAGELFHLRFECDDLLSALDALGEIPLPHYMGRRPDDADLDRYQTVYAKTPGAVAAPTAGLHFDQGILDQLADKGVEMAELTLHVGAGTFQPVRAERLSEHKMHSERFVITEELCEKIKATKRQGKRVVAVGTTVVRTLETAAAQGVLHPQSGESELFITPGYTFKVVDLLLTNFHLPKSTLLMLVTAFGGYEHIMSAYQHAIEAGYRFYSYGDAMLIHPES